MKLAKTLGILMIMTSVQQAFAGPGAGGIGDLHKRMEKHMKEAAKQQKEAAEQLQKELDGMKDGSSSFCAVVYEHENFGGALWAWGKQHESDDISGAMISRRSWHGHLKGWSGKDVSWNDQISSVVVSMGCKLELSDGANFSGEKMILTSKAGARSIDNLSSFNDRTTSFRCTCNGIKDIEIVPGGGPVFFKQPNI